VDFHVSLIGRKDVTGEIYRQVRGAIIGGYLRPGDSLLPSREMARRLNVSRTTVMAAYDRLNGEGFVSSRVGAGTFVNPGVVWPERDRRKPSGRSDGALRPRAVWAGIPLSSAFVESADFDFRTGISDSTLFPYETWRRLMSHELRPSAVGRGVYGDPAGHPALRVAIARHIATARGVRAEPDDVTVTNGTQQALDLVARVLLAPGDRVAVEDPGYMPPWLLFTSLGLKVSGVPVDDEGLVVDALPPNARLVYVTPSHQYPLGVSMSLPRRLALLAWAQRHGAAIVEDDYDSEFRYGGRPIEPLQTLDNSGRVIYIGSFSKTMLATLRLGFVVTPAPLRQATHAAKYVTDWHTSLPTQAALARFIDQGLLARHIRKMRTVYKARHERLVETLTRRLAAHLRLIPSVAGLHVSAAATVASPADVLAAARRALAAGVAVQPLSMFRVDQPPQAGLVLGYGGIDTAHIDEGTQRLRRAFDEITA
jgi:GntR family transcriptional regulator / MocR family aminotransferase